MFNVVLFEPEIPPNTGNIIRLCANSGAHLHLIKPMGFAWDDKQLRRAGLDYHEWANIKMHDNFAAFFAQLSTPERLFGCSTRGQKNYAAMQFQSGDSLLFGPETRGLPREILDTLPVDHILRIPMQPHSRSLNLSNSVAIVLFEAWRQQNFQGGS